VSPSWKYRKYMCNLKYNQLRFTTSDTVFTTRIRNARGCINKQIPRQQWRRHNASLLRLHPSASLQDFASVLTSIEVHRADVSGEEKVWPWPWPFDLRVSARQGPAMDYIGLPSLVSTAPAVSVPECRQADKQIDKQMQLNALSHAGSYTANMG